MNSSHILESEHNPLAHPVLELKKVSRSFTQGRHDLSVLDEADLKIERGELVALIGPSGSGKSTLLQIAGLLEPPNSGDVMIDGLKVEDNDDNSRTELRRSHVGFVYQFHHLLPDFNALENLVLPQLIGGQKRKDAENKAHFMLDRVGLRPRAEHFPSEMSGGEQQRVAIARALINDPGLLLADEPTGNLDPATADKVFDVLLETARTAGLGALIATHDYDLAKRMDRQLRIENGKILEV
tara:strand:- start:634 stop:1353 length:720 start_codon:yes stop_codon:yes gene_type:complete